METGINLYASLPYREIIETFVECGIKNTFIMTNHPELRDAIKMLAENKIKIESFHAPYRADVTVNDIWYDGDSGERMLDIFKSGVDLCREYGVKTLVAHASTGRPMPPITEIGRERYERLFSYAKENSITVAFENHKFFENVKYILDTFPDAGFCWDVGHEACFTQGIDYMALWKKRLSVVHISDSECLPDTDKHLIPFDGKIDFQKVAEKLTGCRCSLMLEVKPGNDLRYKNLSTREYYTHAAMQAKRLTKMVEGVSAKQQICL